MDSISGSIQLNTTKASSAPVAKKEEATTPEQKDSFKKSSSSGGKIWKGFKTGVKYLSTGFGLGSGAVGGFATIGILSSAGGALLALTTGTAVAALATTAGLVGGGIGAAVFGFAGTMGGYHMAEKLGNLMEAAYHKLKG
jgi:hypothetical protein